MTRIQESHKVRERLERLREQKNRIMNMEIKNRKAVGDEMINSFLKNKLN